MPTSLEATLAELIAILSVTHNLAECRQAIEYIRRQLEPFGLHITVHNDENVHPWLFASTRVTQEPEILLVAHLDVVPGDAEMFTLRRQGDALIGRGVYDMKFAAACYLEFVKNHTNELHELNVGLLFTTDEEVGGESMEHILGTGIRPKVAFIPDGGDDWYIEQRAKGFYGVKLEALGRTAHGSRPWEGDSAIERVLNVCDILQDEFPLTTHDGTTLSITGIQGGGVVNQIADHATALMDIRSFERSELDRFNRRIHELAIEQRCEVDFTQSGKPVIFDKTHPNVQKFLAAYTTVRGVAPLYKDSYGGTDARYFAVYNVPCILVEPRGGNRHSSDEWISAEHLATYYTVLEKWLLNDPEK